MNPNDAEGEGECGCACDDWPAWSPRRLLLALAEWAWFIAVPDEPIYIPLRRMLVYNYRPHACHLAEARGSWWAATKRKGC